jgi:hypothetical protein
MLAHRPTVRREVLFPNGNWFILERCCQRVVPSVEKAEHGNDTDNFDNLLFIPVLAQRGKHLIGCRIRHRGCGDRKVERGALSCAEQWAGLIVPNCRNLPILDAKMQGATPRYEPCSIGNRQRGSRRGRSGA